MSPKRKSKFLWYSSGIGKTSEKITNRLVCYGRYRCVISVCVFVKVVISLYFSCYTICLNSCMQGLHIKQQKSEWSVLLDKKERKIKCEDDHFLILLESVSIPIISYLGLTVKKLSRWSWVLSASVRFPPTIILADSIIVKYS